MSEHAKEGGDHPAKDVKAEVIEATVKANQRAYRTSWFVNQAYHDTLQNSKHIARDKHGVPIVASMARAGEALGNDFVDTYMGGLKKAYKLSDDLIEDEGDRLMGFFSGKSEDEWKLAFLKNPTMGYTDLEGQTEEFRGGIINDGQKKAEGLLGKMITNRKDRHKLLKIAGLESKIGKDDEPVLPQQIIPAAYKAILSDPKAYNATVDHMYGLGEKKH